MKTTLKNKIGKLSLGLSIGFIILFIFRLTTEKEETVVATPIFQQTESLESNLEIRKNYATKRHSVALGQAPMLVDQKYEKIADIQSISTVFDRDEDQLRKYVADYNGLIQFENKNGNSGYRSLNLTIGVPPEHFDAIYQQLIQIGTIQAKQITKKDKTNEYKELRAKKLSLEKIRTSLINLKAEGGRIEEYIQLENRILEIEQQLQALGVSLGNFDEENEFCTVKFSLTERKVTHTDLSQRIISAFLWTLSTYLQLMTVLLLIAGFSYLIVSTIEKLRKK
ncbi:DUF4349 domain-containing protein [Maribacter luteus]|nr:DUF4349 domain-containing protein [Maribacter luteus]